MSRCVYCGKEIVFPYRCSYCNRIFCAEHRIAESHECPFLSKAKTPLSPPRYREPSVDSLGRCPNCNTYAISELYYDADTMTFKCSVCGHKWTQSKRQPHEIVETREKHDGMIKVEKKRVGKSKIGLLVSGVLIAIFAFSSLWLYTRMGTLQNQVNVLQADKDNLQNQLSLLQSEYGDYKATHSHSDSEYYSYVASHQYTNFEYDEALFYFYYVKPAEQEFGVYDLDDELNGLEWLHPYQEDVFDCSEMSAYLECYLENEGWNAIIAVGDSPFSSGKHAWLLVETSTGHYMPVESTRIEIVWWSDHYFDNYFTYDRRFETIQDAIAYSENEFDWWKSP